MKRESLSKRCLPVALLVIAILPAGPAMAGAGINPDADEMYYLAKIRGFTRSDMAIAFVRDRVEEGYAVGGVVYGGFIKGYEHGERAEVFGIGLTMDYPEPLKW